MSRAFTARRTSRWLPIGLGLVAVLASSLSPSSAGAAPTQPTAVPSAAAWQVRTASALPRPDGTFDAISCAPDGSCVAIGKLAGNMARRLTATGAWAITPVKGVAGLQLETVDCAARTFCVGTDGTSLYRYDGTLWSPFPLAAVPGSDEAVEAVDCTSPTFCAASVLSFAPDFVATFQVWNGTAWKIVPGPASDPAFSISCAGPKACGGLGFDDALRWDGTRWSTEPIPATPNKSALYAEVSCPDTTTCVAVGVGFDNRTGDETGVSIVRRNGSWKSVPTAKPFRREEMADVSCRSATFCVAGGHITSELAFTPLVEVFDGTAWTDIRVNRRHGAQLSLLEGVTCGAPGACLAAGWDTSRPGLDSSLLVAVNPTNAAIMASPVPVVDHQAGLVAVDCPGPQFCMAAGNLHGGPVTERWHGGPWIDAFVPSPPASLLLINDVDCASTSFCMAVGYADVDADSTEFAAAWTPAGWKQVPTPHHAFAAFEAVSCTSATSCVAVGYVGPSLTDQALIETWDGARWSIVPHPPLDFFEAVSCPSADACVAVGHATNFRPAQTAFFNGTAWTFGRAAAVPSGGSSELRGLECASLTDCVAVGSVEDAEVNQSLRAEHWDGRHWTVMSLGAPPVGAFTGLSSVACPAAGSCYAVGNAGDSEHPDQALVYVLRKGTWTRDTLPALPTGDDGNQWLPSGIGCVAMDQCVAVGAMPAGNTSTDVVLTKGF